MYHKVKRKKWITLPLYLRFYCYTKVLNFFPPPHLMPLFATHFWPAYFYSGDYVCLYHLCPDFRKQWHCWASLPALALKVLFFSNGGKEHSFFQLTYSSWFPALQFRENIMNWFLKCFFTLSYHILLSSP